MKTIIYNIREAKFPKDDIFLNVINNITIELSINIENNKKTFYLTKAEFINFKKNNKLDKYVIFRSEFQLNFYNEVDHIFIDKAFKICPKNYY